MSDYSIRKFSLRMAGRGVTGASRPAVHRYLHATKPVEPPVAFLRAAAAELGVRVAWLVLGEKPMRESVPLDPALTARVEDTWRWLLEGSGSDTVRGQLHALLNRRLSAAKARGASVEPDRIEAWAEEILGYVQEPWAQLSRGIGSTDADWFNYRVAMLHALLLALPEGYLHPGRST